MLDQVATLPIYVLLTVRPDFQIPWEIRSYFTSLILPRLSHDAIEQMVLRVSGGNTLPKALMAHLIERTDGIPLFVEELTKTVLESRLLHKRETHYELRGTLSALAIPTTLQDSLMARLDRLASVKAIAQLAATIGRQFSYNLLQAVGSWNESLVQEGLQRLIEAELIYQHGIFPQTTYTFKHALVQDAAYQSLLKSTRKQYHQQIAQVLLDQFPDIVAHQPELLAHHYTQSGLIEQAVDYWYQAGQIAIERSANIEAINHFHQGLELLHALPDTPECARQELSIQIALGPALQATKGDAAPEVETAYTRAWQLCQQLGEMSQRFTVLRGLWSHALLRADYQRANDFMGQYLRQAQRQRRTLDLVQAQDALRSVSFWRGDLKRAQEQVEAFRVPEMEGLTFREAHALSFWQSTYLFHTAWILWALGYPAQALDKSQEALALAQEMSHPFSLTFALNQSARLHQFRQDVQRTRTCAEASIQLATAQGFPQQLAAATFLRGWARTQQGEPEQGLIEMDRGLTAYSATGARHQRTYFLGLLAQGYGSAKRPRKALAILDESLVLVNHHEERVWEAELHRLQGQLLRQLSPHHDTEAETCYRQALSVAQHQHAKSLELRAAISLSRLWQDRGQLDAARHLLTPVYEGFTEGFDTVDWQNAKALLAELKG